MKEKGLVQIMKVIGITGGVGSGKSVVLQYVKEQFHAYVIDADKVAHSLQKPGNLCYDAIVDYFGTGILTPKGEIDRKKLGALVFADKQKLQMLNAIMHPHVKKEIIKMADTAKKQGEHPYCFIEAALLIEEQYDAICDELWYIYAKKELREKRLMDFRGYTVEKIKKMMSRQLSEGEFRQHCSVVIDNNGSEEYLYKQIKEELTCQNG